MDNLETTAKSVRKRLFEFKTRSGAGHLASCLSCVDILVSLYFDEKTDFDPNKDVVIYSKGHGSPAVYPILVDLGFVEAEELENTAPLRVFSGCMLINRFPDVVLSVVHLETE